MINLLPTSQKEELRQKENLILVANIGILFLSFLISLSLFLLAINFYFFGELEKQRIIFESQQKKLALDLEKEISEKNKFLLNLLQFEKEKKEFFPILDKVFRILPEKIDLKTISMSKEKQEIDVLIIGQAKNLQSLISFKEILENNFGKVSFPSETWLKEENIEFLSNFKTK